jgi:hypothetical protein
MLEMDIGVSHFDVFHVVVRNKMVGYVLNCDTYCLFYQAIGFEAVRICQ